MSGSLAHALHKKAAVSLATRHALDGREVTAVERAVNRSADRGAQHHVAVEWAAEVSAEVPYTLGHKLAILIAQPLLRLLLPWGPLALEPAATY